MKTFLTIIALCAVALYGSSFLMPSPPVSAQAGEVITGQLCRPGNTLDPTACSTGGAQTALGRILSVIVQTLVLVVGGISVIMIVIAGLRYVTSGGDPNTTKGAKDTILYAVIGLVVAIIAQGLVTFVLSRI